MPGLDLSGGYTTTAVINPPAGTVVRQAVLVEWIDTNNSDATFQGTAREILRVGFAGNIHPLGDLVFNPTAQPGHPDYGNLYIAVGDGAAGETAGATHTIPQRLDALPGKILRITPDVNLRTADLLSANGRYRIPSTGSDPNPFVSLTLTNVKKEIYAYGFRNPHRMSWDSVTNRLIVNDIGFNAWEEVDLVIKGGNYGYAEREGPEQLFIGGTNSGQTGSQTSPLTPFPNPDTLTVAGLSAPVTPIYPAMAYSHQEGDAMSAGFVYRGSLMPQLFGMYIFGDITTGRVFYSSLASMTASTRTSPAPIHEIQVVYNSPYNNLGLLNRRVYDIVADAYAARGGDSNPSSSLGRLAGERDGGRRIPGWRLLAGPSRHRTGSVRRRPRRHSPRRRRRRRDLSPEQERRDDSDDVADRRSTAASAGAFTYRSGCRSRQCAGCPDVDRGRRSQRVQRQEGDDRRRSVHDRCDESGDDHLHEHGADQRHDVLLRGVRLERRQGKRELESGLRDTDGSAQSPLPSPWQTSDIGAVAAAGNATWANTSSR